MEMEPSKKQAMDRWILWPYLLWLIFPVSFLILTIFNNQWLEVILAALCIFIELLLLVTMSIVSWFEFKAKRTKTGLSMILLPIFAGAVFLSIPFCQQYGIIMRFYMVRSALQKEVDSENGPDNQKLVIFLEGGFLNAANGYIYDGSDEVALPDGEQSKAWRKRAYQTELQDLCFETDHITGHYYSFDTTHGCEFEK